MKESRLERLHNMILFTCYSRKGKITGTENRSVLPEAGGGGRERAA
jgi:hypothetical protein